MLDLSVPVRTVEGLDLAADESRRNAYYVLPSRPVLAIDNGTPDIELLRFIRDNRVTGGHLHFVASLATDPKVLARARAALADEARLDADRITLAPIPVESAAAQVVFLGHETGADEGITGLVARPFGASPGSVLPPHVAAFSIDLTPDGVRLMESALSAGTSPIAVIYRLRVEGLWPAQQVVAHVDWRRIYDHFSSQYKEGNLLTVTDVQRISEQLIENQVVTIRAVQGVPAAAVASQTGGPAAPSANGSEGSGSQDGEAAGMAAALLWVQRTILEECCEPVMTLAREPARASLGTFGEILGVGTTFAVKKRTQIERATIDIDLQRQSVVSRTITLQTHLADLGASVGRIVDAGPGHPFFERMTLNVRTSRPLADAFVDEAVVNFTYGTVTQAGRLTRAAAGVAFDTWADRAPDRTWSLQPQIAFANDAPLDPGARVLLPTISGREREATLDLHALAGIKRIDVEPRPDPRVLLARATVRRLRAGETSVERVLAFAGDATAAQAAWFRDSRPTDRFEVQTEALLATGRQVDVGTQPLDTRLYRLPAAFPGVLTVHLFADDDWKDLGRVVVSLQKSADQPASTFTFDKPGGVVDVNLPMPDPANRRYRYRTTRTWSSGLVEEDEWVETDVPALTVGRTAANKLVVDVSAIGPELPDVGVRLIEVDLSYVDAPNQVRDVRKAVIGARADRFHWEVGLKDPNRRQYEYRVTVYRTSGDSQVGRWTTTAERLLAIPITAA